jgi:hypothetical protein
MKKIILTVTIYLLAFTSNSFAVNKTYGETLIITAEGSDFACQGFAHPSCFKTDENNLQDAKAHTDINAENKCQDQGFSSAVLMVEHQCEIDKISLYSITTICYGTYRCE